MKLKVNGEQYETEQEILAHLLKELGIIPERVVVEVNLNIIKRTSFENYSLKDWDNVEIVNFVGGG